MNDRKILLSRDPAGPSRDLEVRAHFAPNQARGDSWVISAVLLYRDPIVPGLGTTIQVAPKIARRGGVVGLQYWRDRNKILRLSEPEAALVGQFFADLPQSRCMRPVYAVGDQR